MVSRWQGRAKPLAVEKMEMKSDAAADWLKRYEKRHEPKGRYAKLGRLNRTARKQMRFTSETQDSFEARYSAEWPIVKRGK